MSSKVYSIPAYSRNISTSDNRLYLADAYSAAHSATRCPLGQEKNKFDFFAAVSGVISGKMAAPAIAMARHNLLREFFRIRATCDRSNGAQYDAFYHPRSIEKALVTCQPR